MAPAEDKCTPRRPAASNPGASAPSLLDRPT